MKPWEWLLYTNVIITVNMLLISLPVYIIHFSIYL